MPRFSGLQVYKIRNHNAVAPPDWKVLLQAALSGFLPVHGDAENFWTINRLFRRSGRCYSCFNCLKKKKKNNYYKSFFFTILVFLRNQMQHSLPTHQNTTPTPQHSTNPNPTLPLKPHGLRPEWDG